MPKIKPFRGIRPSQEYVDQVASNIEGWSSVEVQKNPYSALHLFAPKLEGQFLRESQEETVYKQISDNVDHFVGDGLLIRDEKPAIYVYQIVYPHSVQTGIWTSTSIDDYLNNTIKKHELTRPERQQKLIDYLAQTGVDANPVLIAYFAVPSIQTIILETTSKKAELSFSIADTFHKLWKMDDEYQVNRLVEAFSNIQSCYIADGHHRVAAITALGMEQRKLNRDYKGTEGYNYFNSVYMSIDQLHIFEFNRLVQNIGGLSVQQFLNQVALHFEVEMLPDCTAFKPPKKHQFGMYLDKTWYWLRAKPHTHEQHDLAETLDVSILQKYLLAPILHITNPQTDSRLSFVGGVVPLQISIQQIDQGDYAVLFTLFPMSIRQLTSVVDAGQIMPPKSTWFEPKFQSGLVVHQLFDWVT